MIKFEFKNEDYEINDDWELVKAGKEKDFFEEDIRGFFLGFQPYMGDDVLSYVSWLKDFAGLTIKDYKTIDYPPDTVF